jgi:hypothetical protein
VGGGGTDREFFIWGTGGVGGKGERGNSQNELGSLIKERQEIRPKLPTCSSFIVFLRLLKFHRLKVNVLAWLACW